ncbi:MAG: hypothetical protein LBH64_05355 [Coriobacteriales bacterium]|jgi:hypothetical protein|nr:hypothetical protein [Coriobacteriales bacterium]
MIPFITRKKSVSPSTSSHPLLSRLLARLPSKPSRATVLRSLPILLAFLLIAIAVIHGIYAEQRDLYSSLDVSLERSITADGRVIDLHEAKDGSIWVRSLDRTGAILTQTLLSPGNSAVRTAVSFRVLGFADVADSQQNGEAQAQSSSAATPASTAATPTAVTPAPTEL